MFWRKPNKRRARQLFNRTLATESLETRILPAVVTVTKTSTGAATSLTFTGSATNDEVFIDKDTRTGGISVSSSLSTFTVNGVASGRTFSVSGALKDLEFRLGAGNDNIVITTSASSVSIFDGATATERNSIIIGTAGIPEFIAPVEINAVRMEINQGIVQMLLRSGGPRMTIGSLNASLERTTSSEFNIRSVGGDMKIVQTVVTSPSTTSRDTIVFSALTVPDQIGTGSMRLGTVRISTAGGNDNVAVIGPVTVSNVVDAQERAQGFRVDSGTGNDVVSIISSASSRFPPSIYGNVQINTGDGDDVVNLASENQVDLIQFHGNTVIQTGNQSDRIRLERCQFLGPLNVNTGTTNVQGGNDSINFKGSQANSGSMLVMLGTGDIAITGTSTSPARFAAGVWFGVGRGSISVGTPDSTQSYVSFETTHIFAGLIDPLMVTFYGAVNSPFRVRILANARLVRA